MSVLIRRNNNQNRREVTNPYVLLEIFKCEIIEVLGGLFKEVIVVLLNRLHGSLRTILRVGVRKERISRSIRGPIRQAQNKSVRRYYYTLESRGRPRVEQGRN